MGQGGKEMVTRSEVPALTRLTFQGGEKYRLLKFMGNAGRGGTRL